MVWIASGWMSARADAACQCAVFQGPDLDKEEGDASADVLVCVLTGTQARASGFPLRPAGPPPLATRWRPTWTGQHPAHGCVQARMQQQHACSPISWLATWHMPCRLSGRAAVRSIAIRFPYANIREAMSLICPCPHLSALRHFPKYVPDNVDAGIDMLEVLDKVTGQEAWQDELLQGWVGSSGTWLVPPF